MYALYSPEASLIKRIQSALPRDEAGVATTSWSRFEAFAPRAQCLIIAARWPAWELRLPLEAPVVARSAAPLILVTTKDADNARRALHAGAVHLVWLNDLERELHPLICRVRTRFLLHRTADLLDASTILSLPLRNTLAFACRAERPIRSVGELSTRLRRNRKTLWRHWHCVNGVTGSLRLEDFLDWILVLHAAHLKPVMRSWAQVATTLGTHEHTLSRMMTRLARTKLGDANLEALESRFFETAVRPLTGG